MSHLELLKNERKSVASVFFEFTQAYNRSGSNDIFVFFEGDDDTPFYMPEIRRRWDRKGRIYNFICNGKYTVIDVAKKVHKKINNKNRALFFIDKDLSDILKNKNPRSKNFFITDYYSIENYLITPKMFKIIWTDIFQLYDSDSRLDEYIKIFKNSYKDFVNLMKPIMGWITHHKKDGKDVSLRNVKLDKMLSFRADFKIEQKTNAFIYLAKETKIANGLPNQSELDKMINTLEKFKPKYYIRGKFELWFFVKFVNYVLDVVKKKNGVLKRAKAGMHITVNSAIMCLSGKIPYPKTFTNFLKYNLSRV